MIGGNEAFVRQTYLDPTAIDAQRMRLTLIHTEVDKLGCGDVGLFTGVGHDAD
jgi:hypothetical protein